MSAIARWCFRRRWLVLGLWIVLAVGLSTVLASAGGTSYADSFSLPGTGSTKAMDLLRRSVPDAAGDSETIVWKVSSGTVRDPQVRTRVTALLARVEAAPHVAGVASPYARGGEGQVSRNGRTAYAVVGLDGQAGSVPLDDVRKLVDLTDDAARPGLSVEIGGQAVRGAIQNPIGISDVVGLLAAGVVLALAFRALLATLLPLVTAIFGIFAGLQATGLLSHAFDVASIAPTIATLVALGVGIDYALFVVTRHRTGLKAGMDPQEAAVTALNTSGRAVVFAGGTVCVALLGLLVLGVGYLNGIGVAAAVTVLFAVAAAITLLPALLGVIGIRALSRRERRELAERGPVDAHAGTWFTRWAAVLQRRPRALGAVALAVMVALAVPTLSLRLGTADAGNDPASSTTRKSYDILSDAFGPGFNGPLLVVAERRSGNAGPADVARIAGALRRTPGVTTVAPAPVPDSPVSVYRVVPASSPQSERTSELIARIRHEVAPPLERATSSRVYVGGATATSDDFADVVGGKLPLLVTVIVVLGAVLLMVAFRSLLVPLTAAVMNLLAAGASFGIVVAVFQKGVGVGALGFGRAGPVEAFLPVMMLAVLFGLSMDYQMFLVSRMHEEWGRCGDNARSVRVGQGESGRVIAAAALIMACVFMAFLLTGDRVVGEFGVGLSSAVLLDAFLLRLVLVPALMHLSGRANWYLPGWLDRLLPRLSVEGGAQAPVDRAPEPSGVGR